MKALILTLFAVAAYAQTSNPLNVVRSNPGGPCAKTSIQQYNIANGTYWSCTGTNPTAINQGVWQQSPAIAVPAGIVAQNCGATASCAATSTALKVVVGKGTLVTGSPSTFAVTGISPAFTSASTYTCTASDTTTIANNIGVLTAGYISGSAVTFTGPATNTDTFNWTCVGY